MEPSARDGLVGLQMSPAHPFYDVNDFSGAVSGPSAGLQVEKLIYSK